MQNRKSRAIGIFLCKGVGTKLYPQCRTMYVLRPILKNSVFIIALKQ